MTDESAVHPKRDELVAFGLEKLAPADATDIADHLDRCPDCANTIVGLQDDTFVGLVRQSPAQLISPVGSEHSPPPEGPGRLQATVGAASEPNDVENQPLDLPRELREHPRYEIAELIGRGGMGDVYKAQHKLMNRPVALKVIKPELVRNNSAALRFQREVQAAARLHHRNIITSHDAERTGDLHYLVMEYVDGVNLDEVVRERGALPVELACDYIRQAAEGLQHAHEQGMIHRDIKPHNLMVTAAGEVKILDFGLASFVSELAACEASEASVASASSDRLPALEQLTLMGTMMGTPDYIAPEQARDSHAADIRADIYSLGCTFYALLTGRAPFSGGTVLEKIRAHAEQTPKALAEFRSDVPAEVEPILLRMMAKNPDDRQQAPREVAMALTQCMSPTPPEATTASRAVRARVPRRTLAAIGFMSLCAFLAAAVFYIRTDTGVVRVEVADESLEVTLSGQTISMKDGVTPLTIRAGSPKLVVRRGDFVFETESFQLRRGDRVALKVELLSGEVVVQKNGKPFEARKLPKETDLAQELIPPIRIGTNEEGAPMLNGRLVPPHELSDLLIEALAQHPDRIVTVDVPKRPWTVVEHVEQYEQIARIAGAKRVERPDWSQIRIVLGVEKSGLRTLDIEAPGYEAGGSEESRLSDVREVVEKNPGLPVLLEAADGVDLADARIAAEFNEVRRLAEATGAEVRLGERAPPGNESPESRFALRAHLASLADAVDDEGDLSAWMDADAHVSALLSPNDPATRAVLRLLGSLSRKDRERLLKDGYLKWPYSQLDSRWQSRFQEAVRLRMFPKPAATLMNAETMDSLVTKALKNDVGFFITDIPDSDEAMIGWFPVSTPLPVLASATNLDEKYGAQLLDFQRSRLQEVMKLPRSPLPQSASP